MAKVKDKEATPDIQNIMLNYMNDVLDECEKKEAISSTIDSGYYLSTGLLTFDMVMNGGIRSGWTTSLGLEQSGKTSLAIKILGSLVKENIPGYFLDAEGSLNTEYTCAIAGIDNVEEYFGRKSPTGKGYEIVPKIRYTSENGMEKIFRFMHRILLKLPDKLYREETKKWYYVFDKTKEDVALMKSLDLHHDAKLYSATGRYWCEAPDGKFQVVFILDSLPGLEPEASGEDADGATNAMAFKARVMAKVASPVRGLLRRKHAVLLPVNQQRQAPGVMFGPSEYEPMGNYIKFASDVRNELASRNVPDWFEKGKTPAGSDTGQYGEEASVEGPGKDRYMYKLIKNIKNKNGIPYRQGWTRIWNSDYNGKCRGFDPVFDTIKYLEYTKQVSLVKVNGRREISGLEKWFPELKGNVQYADFKRLILGFETGREDLLQEFIKNTGLQMQVSDLPNIRKICFEQIQSGEAFDLLLVKSVNNEINTGDEDFEDLESKEKVEFSEDFDEEDFEELN